MSDEQFTPEINTSETSENLEAVAPETTTVTTKTTENADEVTDIFHWANTTDAVKNDLEVEFFLFNKNYTPYHVNFSDDLVAQIRSLFLYDLINDVNLGAGTGMMVREFEKSESEEGVLLRTRLENVGRAETLIHLIEHERGDIEVFSDEEHDVKRIKGIIARYTMPGGKGTPFYAVKALNQSGVMKRAASWEFSGGKLKPFQPDFGLKVPADNHVLVIDRDIFVFNPSKFEKLFQYDYKKQALADKKVAEIESTYKLSFAEGADLQSLVRDRPKIVNKLQKLEVGEISQEKAIEYADEMQLDLMTDDSDAIIIMDGHDLDMFVSLINEDYMTSGITGKRYEIKSKKLLDPADGEPPRG